MTSLAGAPSGMVLVTAPVVPLIRSSAPLPGAPSARPMTPLSDSVTDRAVLLTETLPMPFPFTRLMSTSSLPAALPASAHSVPFACGWPAASRFFGADKISCGVLAARAVGAPLALPPDEQAASAPAASATMTVPATRDRVFDPYTDIPSCLVVASRGPVSPLSCLGQAGASARRGPSPL